MFASEKQNSKPISTKPERPPPPTQSITKPKEEIIENTSEPKESSEPKSILFDSIGWEENKGKHEIDNEFQVENQTSRKPVVSDLLLNLSIDETGSQNTVLSNEIPTDLFEGTAPQMDLFGGISDLMNKTSTNNTETDSNVNLLNDLNLFASNPITPPINPMPSMAAFDSNPLNAMTSNSKFRSPTLSSGPTLNNTTVPLQRNTSTPNLTNLDPLAQLGSFMSTAVTSNAKTNSTSIPRVASYSTFQTANPLKPDYSRTHFDVKNNPNNTSTSNAKTFGNEFEDLLGGFKPTQNDSTNKSIAQMRREEMV